MLTQGSGGHVWNGHALNSRPSQRMYSAGSLIKALIASVGSFVAGVWFAIEFFLNRHPTKVDYHVKGNEFSYVLKGNSPLVYAICAFILLTFSLIVIFGYLCFIRKKMDPIITFGVLTISLVCAVLLLAFLVTPYYTGNSPQQKVITWVHQKTGPLTVGETELEKIKVLTKPNDLVLVSNKNDVWKVSFNETGTTEIVTVKELHPKD